MRCLSGRRCWPALFLLLLKSKSGFPGWKSRDSCELATWLRDYDAWEKWFERWGNRVVHNFNDQIGDGAQGASRAAGLARGGMSGPIGRRPMRRTTSSSRGVATFSSTGKTTRRWCVQRKQCVAQPLKAGQAEEKVVKTSSSLRLHLTGGWTQAQYPSDAHLRHHRDAGGRGGDRRFTIPAIGVMLMMIPDGRGGHEWKPATTLGLGVRLFHFAPPLLKRQASVHFNVARTQRSWRWGYPELLRDRHQCESRRIVGQRERSAGRSPSHTGRGLGGRPGPRLVTLTSRLQKRILAPS